MVLITEMLEICIQTSYDQSVQLIFKELSPCSVRYHLNIVEKQMLLRIIEYNLEITFRSIAM